MSETVCVTLEQLRQIESVLCSESAFGPRRCPACDGLHPERMLLQPRTYGEAPTYETYPVEHSTDCWIAEKIAEAKSLEKWAIGFGDVVTIKNAPSMHGKVIDFNDRFILIETMNPTGTGISVSWRHRNELMPKEGE